MSRFFGLAALALLMALMFWLPVPAAGGRPLSMTLGFLLLAGFVCGKLGNRIGLPGITGYLVAGIALGPAFLGIMDQGTVQSLQMINSFALTLIGLTAGGEVDLRRIARRLKSFMSIALFQVLMVFGGMLSFMTLSLRYFPDEFPLAFPALLAVSSFFAVISLSKSPGSTVALIVESGAQGRMTELTLGITIVNDIVVILTFAITFGFVSSLLIPAASTAGHNLVAEVAWEIGGSIIFGIISGMIIIGYMKYVGGELPIFIIALSYLTAELSHLLHLHPILVCMIAGLAVNNLSSRGHRFIEAIEKGSLPLYVVFFAIAGAGINFGILKDAWLLVILLAAGRLSFTWFGSWLGAYLAKEEPRVRNNIGMSFLSQAEISLGLAVMVAQAFPGWGVTFKSVVIGSIAIFQIIGPVLFKVALGRAGELPGGLSAGSR
ncbi:MAG: cation:proton antiporter [Candidatus Glassbacteria bacterium]